MGLTTAMERNSELVTVDAAAVLDQVASRLRQEALLPEETAVRIHSGRVHHGNKLPSSGVPASGDYVAQIAIRLQSLQSGLDSRVEAAVRNIGAAPPAALSLRGRIGATAIRVLRGLLWWQTRS